MIFPTLTRLQNKHCYAKTAVSVSDNHTVNEMAVDMGRASSAGHTTLFPTSTPYITPSFNAKHTMTSADLFETCSTRDTTSGSLIPLQGTPNRFSQHPDTRFTTQATNPANQVHTQVGALGSTQFCSTASNVGKCMVNLTTSQPPLVLSSNSNVYASPLSSLLSSSTQPQLTLQSLISSLTPLLAISRLSVSRTGYPPKPATIKSDKPFYITKLNNRIKKMLWMWSFV